MAHLFINIEISVIYGTYHQKAQHLKTLTLLFKRKKRISKELPFFIKCLRLGSIWNIRIAIFIGLPRKKNEKNDNIDQGKITF